nr:hypothetical protein [Candidatus Brachybacter algidus]
MLNLVDGLLQEAIELLKTLADNDASKSLVELIDYVTNREN